MKTVSQRALEFAKARKLGSVFTDNALKWFIPFIEQHIIGRQSDQKTLFIGINGCQGSGKSTLAEFLEFMLTTCYRKEVVNFSIDDFYFSKDTRQGLAKTVHPLLATRGVPATHDSNHLKLVLQQLAAGQACDIPVFDKANDDQAPRSQWHLQRMPADVVIVEGWCWGVQAQTEQDLIKPLNTLESTKDPKGLWRSYVNYVLRDEYSPLYKMMDVWVMLKAPSFDCVHQWRKEQEHKLKARSKNSNAGMSDEQLETFIQHFERLTRQSLGEFSQAKTDTSDAQNPTVDFDAVFELDASRQILSDSAPVRQTANEATLSTVCPK